MSLHAGGAQCPCQRSAEERAAALEQLRSQPMWSQASEGEVERQRQVDARVREIEKSENIVVASIGGIAPMQIMASIDGYHVYVRERHGEYTIQASRDVAAKDIDWLARHGEVICSGLDSQLYAGEEEAEVNALECTVAAVRDRARRSECSHTSQGSRFCSWCGERLRP